MPRRGDADPLLLQTVSQRLALLLAETPPRPGADGPDPPGSTTPARAVGTGTQDAEAPSSWLDDQLVAVEDVPRPRRFGRRHLAVVCVLLLAGLLWTSWSVLRARPVALASPVTASASAFPGSASGPTPTVTAPATAVPSGQATAARVVVHVLGAVRRPGLVSLAERSRVQDAVDAAGGFTRHADPGQLNLAQLLQDGQQIVIGTSARPTGEVRGSGGATGGSAPGSAGAAPGGSAQLVDLNTATEEQLEELPGVGPVTAAKIAAWRSEHGRFSRIEELQEVDGIGPKTYAEIAPHVRV